jgi:cytosolic phospholipase A2
MKKILFSIILIFSYTMHSAPPLHDIQLEFNHDNTDRWPEFLISFYDKIKDILHDVQNNLSTLPETFYQAFIAQNQHHADIAHVRYTANDDLCQEEQNFIEKRRIYVKEHLEKFLNIPLEENKIPRIGLVFSGGGFRAMLATLGFLCGAEKIGLLDSTFYCTGLSGSSWALAPWIASGKNLQEYTSDLTNKLAGGIDHINDPYELSELLQIFITKLLCNQFVSTIDIYGSILANTLLKGFVKKPLLVKLTDSHQHILDGHLPMPIYTAIQSQKDPYEWMEVTPLEIGSSFLKSYIPTWAYGRKFKEGISLDKSPEQTLGYFMGIFGSAFEVNLKDIVRISASNLSYLGHQLPELLAAALKNCLKLILDSFIGEVRLFPSMLANFTYLFELSPIKDEKSIALVDAGIDFNLPFPPLLRAARNVDIIIVYDASSSLVGVPELKRAALYAKRNGIKFPPIDFELAEHQPVSIFKDSSDPATPVIIYFPRIKNNNYNPSFDPDECIELDYCNTFNFDYKPEEARLLTGFAEFCIKEKESAIKQAIEDVLIHKYSYALKQETPEISIA